MATAAYNKTAWHPTPRVCGCGCGGIPSRGHFLRGHWRKATRRVHYQLETAPGEMDLSHPFIPIGPTAVGQSPALDPLRSCFVDAWQHRTNCPRRLNHRPCPQCLQDRAWALATAALAPIFSFIGMCEILGLDPDQTREVFLCTAN